MSELRSQMHIGVHLKYPVLLSNIIETVRVSKNTLSLNFVTIRPVGAEFHVDGRTDGRA